MLAKLDLVKRSGKRFVLNNSKCQSILPQIEVNYQPIHKKDKKACKNAKFAAQKQKRIIKVFSNETVTTLGTLVAPIQCKNWSAETHDDHTLEETCLRLWASASNNNKRQTNLVNCVNTPNPMKEQIAKEFLGLKIQILKSKTTQLNQIFKKITKYVTKKEGRPQKLYKSKSKQI